MILENDNLIEFGKFPKAKYTLYIANENRYFFVTTSKSEEEAIEIMKEKANLYKLRTKRSFYVKKKEGDKKTIIYKGFV